MLDLHYLDWDVLRSWRLGGVGDTSCYDSSFPLLFDLASLSY